MNNNISIFHTNICSLQGNVDNLTCLLSDLNHNFDIIALTETWNPENKKHLFQAPHLENYSDFKGTTGTTTDSGADLYFHENLHPTTRTDLDFKFYEKDNEEFESIWFELNNESNPNLIVASIYRHPTEKSEKCLDYLKKTLTKLKKAKNKMIAITADHW